jgi:hypothetical protein
VKVKTLGIDLAKETFGLHGVDALGRVAVHRRVTRKQLVDFLVKLEPCLVGMEACGSAHYWAREIDKLGHTVKLMSPQFVVPYRKGNKNDPNDAEAICEAVSRPSMRFVPIKNEEQQDLQALHRVREQLVKNRCNRNPVITLETPLHRGWVHIWTFRLVQLAAYELGCARSARRGIRWRHRKRFTRSRLTPTPQRFSHFSPTRSG